MKSCYNPFMLNKMLALNQYLTVKSMSKLHIYMFCVPELACCGVNSNFYPQNVVVCVMYGYDSYH